MLDLQRSPAVRSRQLLRRPSLTSTVGSTGVARRDARAARILYVHPHPGRAHDVALADGRAAVRKHRRTEKSDERAPSLGAPEEGPLAFTCHGPYFALACRCTFERARGRASAKRRAETPLRPFRRRVMEAV